MLKSRHYLLDRLRLLARLSELEASEDAVATLYLPADMSREEIAALLVGALGDVPEEMAGMAVASKTGTVVFAGPGRILLVAPPFPMRQDIVSLGFYLTEPLRALVERKLTIALVLVRLGSFAVGLAEDGTLTASKVGTGLVHARHRQGGSSAARFRRHREKQIEYFLTRACGHIRERLEPYANRLDYIVYGGAKTTITLLQKRCMFLQRLDVAELPPLLEIPDPRQPVLEQAVRHVWSSAVTEWREAEQ
jgi:hypothetical protein